MRGVVGVGSAEGGSRPDEPRSGGAGPGALSEVAAVAPVATMVTVGGPPVAVHAPPAPLPLDRPVAVPRRPARWERAAKRTLDVTAALLILLLTLPLLLAVAVAVKVSSPGPVLFRQERIGRHRRPFTMVKFRTMRVPDGPPRPPHRATNAEEAHRPLKLLREKTEELARATRVGAFLRRSGLDELPQLCNVLAGQMSLVGPRPFVAGESEHLGGWAALRFEVRPGITGLWQVSGRNELSTHELRHLDFAYVATWSLWSDARIIWATPRVMLRGAGAY